MQHEGGAIHWTHHGEKMILGERDAFFIVHDTGCLCASQLGDR
ncbi:hypothetical protein [Caballeronia arvi]|nr:hypothetical protein [Caballeronia arvi]